MLADAFENKEKIPFVCPRLSFHLPPLAFRNNFGFDFSKMERHRSKRREVKKKKEKKKKLILGF